MISVVAILLVGVLSTCAGAFAGRWLVFRTIDHELRPIIHTARRSSERANVAAASLEAVQAHWPKFLERVEELDRLTEEARDVVRRQDELESAIAGAFNISVRAG